jgi:hypothetical protein
MLRTALLFFVANLASLPLLALWFGYGGPLGALWFSAILQTEPRILLPLLFIWVPAWLWVAAIRRAWQWSPEPQREEYVAGRLLG